MIKPEQEKEPLKQLSKRPDYYNDDSKKGDVSRINLLNSNELDNFIKNLNKPQFLGSIHLTKASNPKFSAVENLLTGELEFKLTSALKSTLFNPVTKILILSAIVFNIFWFLFLYLL